MYRVHSRPSLVTSKATLTSSLRTSAMVPVNVIGYPFAGGQPRDGVEETPGRVFKAPWFRSMQSAVLTCETVDVTNPRSNATQDACIIEGHIDGAQNTNNVLESSQKLADATEKALRNG
jgi:hypothetical protein